MKTFIPLVVVLFLVGCATTSQLERRRMSIRECTIEFLQYEATVKNATSACIDIYTKEKIRP